MKELIIDGYNVIKSWSELKQIKSLEIARDKLAQMLYPYADVTDVQITIVFDGKGKETEILPGNPRIVFTKKGESADSYIERAVYESKERPQIRVATDDRLHQQLIFGMGSFYLSTAGLKEEVENKALELRQRISDLKRPRGAK